MEFKVMITFPDLLEITIEKFNSFYGTDFIIKKVIDDEVPFCIIGASKYTLANVFDLGYSLAAKQYTMREKGEIDW